MHQRGEGSLTSEEFVTEWVAGWRTRLGLDSPARRVTSPASSLMAADDEGLVHAPGDEAAEVQEAPSVQHTQPPILTSLDGGGSIDFDSQERSAWSILADACADALVTLHPHHPERHQFQVMLRECRLAAGQQLALGRLSMT